VTDTPVYASTAPARIVYGAGAEPTGDELAVIDRWAAVIRAQAPWLPADELLMAAARDVALLELLWAYLRRAGAVDRSRGTPRYATVTWEKLRRTLRLRLRLLGLVPASHASEMPRELERRQFRVRAIPERPARYYSRTRSERSGSRLDGGHEEPAELGAGGAVAEPDRDDGAER